MMLKSDENTLKRLVIITITLFIVTVCTVTSLFPSAHAQLAPASNSTTAARTGSPAQLSLRYLEFSSDPSFVGEPITMRVGPIWSNQTGVYSATAVITPQIGGVESLYESYASYSKDSNWFTFNFVLREAGNYTITVWQGGVKQVSREISVGSTTSTGGGAIKPNPEAMRAAEEAARVAGTQSGPSAQTRSESSSIPSQFNLQWVIVLLIIVASSVWFLSTIVRS